ncbi:MAG TPA: type I-E CRISPR-associated protein Cas6/Cse3/CasE [Burkholderiaceae bacterium]|nr:type I-E CRISPR-associated protein Cas6/Cse3/CasE [Burkholderiaceae bacterium]HQR70298.1 type I-E CRISPR-associated protein Cas6/Cse3/CasE [Burkholderiaceae bacterium]
MDVSLRLPAHWLGSTTGKGKGPKTLRAFVNTVMSYTKMDVPTVELYETAVTFSPKHADPLSAHAALTRTFGKKAGVSFVFRADTATQGRYWVYSGDPWLEPPAEAISALAPKRLLVQLAEGLPYRFALEACVGRERMVEGEKEVEPFKTPQEVEAWLVAVAPKFGFKPDFFNVAIKQLEFPYGNRTITLPYASIEGVLEVTDAELLKKPLLRGIGSYRRVGLGLLQLSN